MIIQSIIRHSFCSYGLRFNSLSGYKVGHPGHSKYVWVGILYFREGLNSEKCVNICYHYISMGTEGHTLFTVQTISKIKDADLKQLSFTIDLVQGLNLYLGQYHILNNMTHFVTTTNDLFTIEFNGTTLGVQNLLATIVLKASERNTSF